MSWGSVSDFEINKTIKTLEKEKRIAECKAWAIANGNTEDEAEFFCNPPDNVYSIQIPDYCNSWADMGPIIAENRLHLNPNPEGWMAMGYTETTLEDGTICLGNEISFDARPLRAAAIVYLMMNGVNPEDCK